MFRLIAAIYISFRAIASVKCPEGGYYQGGPRRTNVKFRSRRPPPGETGRALQKWSRVLRAFRPYPRHARINIDFTTAQLTMCSSL